MMDGMIKREKKATGARIGLMRYRLVGVAVAS